MTHRHGQQCGGGLWEWGWAGRRRAKGKKIGTAEIE